jgi:pSer/pThr/pTyr-binding forkhead associated (FHA) protein
MQGVLVNSEASMSAELPKGLAKIYWDDPNSSERKEYILTEGATISIGRSVSNEVVIREQHVSRKHAVISYQYGLFMISDLGSANGTFVNDQPLTEPFPLASGDKIRLYVPVINFSGTVTADEEERAMQTGTFIMPPKTGSRPRLSITAGPQEGTEIVLHDDLITIGRATVNANWTIGLQDRAVSRPHAKIERFGNQWYITDMGSSNGTMLNNRVIQATTELMDGHVIVIGQTTILFRLGGG